MDIKGKGTSTFSQNEKSDILKNASEENYDKMLERINNTAFINKRVNKMEYSKIGFR